ncbi:MAG: hypothetical protein ACPL7M_05090 [Bryobacteraceae bacterium]
MLLLRPNGEGLVIDPAVWRRALALAHAHGWRPAGTLPPPIHWDATAPAWHGQYEPAAGQEVSRPDARSLADSLERAAAAEGAAGVLPLAAFCRVSGFLLCPAPNATDSLLALVHHIGVRQPQSDPAAEPRIERQWSRQ